MNNEVMKRDLFQKAAQRNPAVAQVAQVEKQASQMGAQLGQEYANNMMQTMDGAKDYATLINGIRGNERPIQDRYQELASLVGEPDAESTPESVLALVQPTLMMTEQGAANSGIGELLSKMSGDMEMSEAGATNGVGSLLAAGQQAPQNFNQGGPVRKYAPGGPVIGNIQGPTFTNLPTLPEAGALNQAYQDRLKVYQNALGIDPEKRKENLESDILFDISKAALAFGAGVDPVTGENMARQSMASQLMRAAQPLPGTIQERLAAQRQEDQGLKLGALQSAEEFMKARNDALAQERLTNMRLGADLYSQLSNQDFTRGRDETAQAHQERLQRLQESANMRLQRLKGDQNEDSIMLQGQINEQLEELRAQLTSTRDQALHEMGLDKLGVMQGYDIEKMELGFDQKKELTKLQGTIEAEAAALERTSREMMQDKELTVKQAMQRAQIKSAKELQKLEQIWKSSENSIDRDFNREIESRREREAQINRDLKLAMQTNDIEAQKALQAEQLDVRRELQILQQEWQSAESGLDRETKVDIVDRQIQQQVFDRLQQDRQFKTKAELEAYGLAIEEAKNKYTQLGSTIDGRMMSYVLNADNMGTYADGTMPEDQQTRYEQFVLSLTQSGWKPDPVTGQMKYSQGEKLAPAVMESLKQGNPDFYREITKSLSRSGQVPFEDRTSQEQADYISLYGDPNQPYSERDPGAYALGLPAPPKGLDIMKLDRTILPDPNIDFSQAFGAPRVFGGMLNTVSDLFGGGLPALDVAKASNVMAALKQEVLAYMDEATEGRPSNFQITIANELIPLADNASKLFTGDEEAYQQLEKLTGKMRRSLVEQSQKWQMEAEKDPEMLQKDRIQYNNLRNTLATLETIRRGLGQNLNSSQSSGKRASDFITPIE